MMKKLMLGAAISALALSGAFAQASNGPNSNPPAAGKSDRAKPATTGQGAGSADFVMSQKPDQWLASTFKGTDVVGADNRKIGDVTDILSDKTGKIEAYVVSVGGFLGVGAKDVALPPGAFEVIPGSNGAADILKLSMSQDRLKQAQNFKPYQPPRPATTSAGSRPLGGPPSGGITPGNGQ